MTRCPKCNFFKGGAGSLGSCFCEDDPESDWKARLTGLFGEHPWDEFPSAFNGWVRGLRNGCVFYVIWHDQSSSFDGFFGSSGDRESWAADRRILAEQRGYTPVGLLTPELIREFEELIPGLA